MSVLRRATPSTPAAAVFAAAFLAAALLCSSIALADPTPIKFAFTSRDDNEQQLLMKQVKRFNERQDDIRVEVIPRLWEGYGIFDSYVRFLALQDPSVDVYLVDAPWIPEFVEPDWLEPLDEYFPDADQTFVGNAAEWGRYQGELYGLPMELKGNMLFYRADLLEKHGLDPPRTMAELRTTAATIQQAEDLPYGIALHALFFHNDVFPFFFASGGDVLDESGQLILNSETNRKVLAELERFFEPGPSGRPVAPPRSEFLSAWTARYDIPVTTFARGDAVFVLTWSRDLQDLNEPGSAVAGKVGIMGVPGLESNGTPGSVVGSWYLAISAASRHKPEAAEFIRYLTSREVQQERLDQLKEVPSRQALLDEAAASGDYPDIAAMRPILEASRPRPRVPNERAFDAVIEKWLYAMVRDEVSPDEALESAARELEPLLPESDDDLAQVSTESAAVAPLDSRTAPVLYSTILVAILVLLIPFLLWIARRLTGIAALNSIGARISVLAIVLSLLALDVAIGFTTYQAIQDQDEEFEQSRAFNREQAVEHAITTVKNLSLSASIMADAGDDDQALSTEAMKQLMSVSHFSQDLLFVEIRDLNGTQVISQQDALSLAERAEEEFPPPGDLTRRVQARRVLVQERVSPGGTPYLDAVAPIHRYGKHLGALRIGLSQARFVEQMARIEARHQQRISDIMFTAGLFGLLVLLAATAASILLGRRLAKPIVELTEKAEAIQRGNLDVAIESRSDDEIGVLARSMAEMVTGLQDRDFIRDAFGRYVDQSVVDRFLADPSQLELGGEKREVAVLMSDLRGFTRQAVSLGPAKTVRLLNRYFNVMFEVIEGCGGMVNEVRGDGILVVFGAPEPAENDRERALQCAIEMQQALIPFNEELEDGEPRLEMGIAVHYGDVIAGNIGSERRAKYGIVGDAVNLTARIEGLSIGGDIVISDEIAATIEGLELADTRTVRVKGRAEPLTIHRLVALEDLQAPPVERPELRPVELSGHFRRLDGKTIEEDIHPMTVDALAEHGAQLSVAGLDLQESDELVLRIELDPDSPDGDEGADGDETDDIYAKVVELDDDDVLVHFTSVAPRDQQRLARATEPETDATADDASELS